jgi:DNA-binding NarL/FixJ family response regulator
METPKEIKIIIIGDFLIFRSGLKLRLEAEKNIKVVGETANLSEASILIQKVKPNILLIDSSEADTRDFPAFASLQPEHISIIVITNSAQTERHRKYLMLGINGVVRKEQSADVLVKAINAVSNGETWFVRKLLNETIKKLLCEKKSHSGEIHLNNCSALTVREREVLTLICHGMKNKETAEKLFLSEATVRHHLTSIFEKLKVHSRLELVVHAFSERIIEIPAEDFEFSNELE